MVEKTKEKPTNKERFAEIKERLSEEHLGMVNLFRKKYKTQSVDYFSTSKLTHYLGNVYL